MKKAALALAPMAGVGDRAFREVCAPFGVDLFTSEMISAKALTYGDKKSVLLADHGPSEAPFFLQLFGSEPAVVGEAVGILAEKTAFDGIDLNFGCPVPKIVKNGEGSALLRDPDLCGRIVEAAVAAAPCPVSVKMRLGWDGDHLTAVEVARVCEAAGAARLTVHGRTRADLYRDGTVRIDEIARVAAAVTIPVFANGDVKDGASAVRMLAETGAAGIAVGRGALGRPWVFAEIRAALEGKSAPAVDRKAVMRRHVALAFRYKPLAAAGELRTHMAHYLRGFRGAAALRAAVSAAATPADYEALIARLPDRAGAR